MHRITRLLLTGMLCLLAACGDQLPFHPPLPFPTPGQHDLIVLVQPGPLTYSGEDPNNPTGLERDLIESFALELGVGVKYQTVSPGELPERLRKRDYHLAIGWLSPDEQPDIVATPPIYQSRDRLMQHEASLPLTEPEQLAGKTIHTLAGSRQAANLKRLAEQFQDLNIVEVGDGDIMALLKSLAEHKVNYVAVDGMLEDIAVQFYPSLRATLPLSSEHPVVWLMGQRPNVELAERVRSFVERIQRDGSLARLEDRYLGHVRRLTQADVETFLGQIESTLPKLRKWFEMAETITGLDWRLIAAVAYHESHWDPNATSYTNVRGIMMLTEETADRLGVTNRLNPKESILAGARYINLLKDMLPESVSEPDRTWLALAAYNIGPGNFNAARNLAKLMKADPDTWYEMKQILPLMAKPKYYEKVKSSGARGGEAVVLVENIHSYYDILLRNQNALRPLSPRIEGMIGMSGHTPGLKLKSH